MTWIGSPPNTAGGTVTFTDPAVVAGAKYRVVAQNTVGDTWDYADPNVNEIVTGGFPTVTATAMSNVVPSSFLSNCRCFG